MLRSYLNYIAYGILAVIYLSVLAASQSAAIAPIPEQIIHGKNVFISNLMGESFTSVTDQPYYNAFYAAVGELGRYRLVSRPEDADLVFQLRAQGGFVQLIIIDPHTHIELWAISRQIATPRSLADVAKDTLAATNGLAGDLKLLITASVLPSAK